MIFAPLYRRLLRRLKHRRSAAALLTMTIVLLIVVLPAALVVAALASEAAYVYQQLQSGAWNPWNRLQGSSVCSHVGRYGPVQRIGVMARSRCALPHRRRRRCAFRMGLRPARARYRALV